MTWLGIGGLVCLGMFVLLIVAVIGVVYLLKLSDAEAEKRMRENGKPVLAVLVMVNSEFLRNKNIKRAPALGLISFEPPSESLADEMREVASDLFKLYTASDAQIAGLPPYLQEMAKNVKDHGFRPDRRRPVASQMCEGKELYMADLLLERKDIPDHVAETSVLACMATGTDEGEINVIPQDQEQAQEIYAAVGAEQSVF